MAMSVLASRLQPGVGTVQPLANAIISSMIHTGSHGLER